MRVRDAGMIRRLSRVNGRVRLRRLTGSFWSATASAWRETSGCRCSCETWRGERLRGAEWFSDEVGYFFPKDFVREFLDGDAELLGEDGGGGGDLVGVNPFL